MKKPHMMSIGKVPNYGDVIKNRAMRIGRPKIAKGKHKLFKMPVRIPRGIKI